ncbi:hypothetical protein SmJEL517_g04311 [Synchytrium microbalum]|uniref:Nitroreductase domain-containing protein n=1 Tax=Synchytrium microbalum TaxID=1806994 RepID=A0A507C3G0_9FUNG|nr:uncharacterized protein SmJEL517_g04311 [Synchytrium microbalum]TPX32634.1 hypothetical protein SmJEL517_g04311 [Synchytrium microbalum]
MSAQPFLNAIATRRSLYAITAKSTITDARIVEIVKHSVAHVPTSFNNQTNRAVVLFKKDSDRLWDIVLATLKPIVPADQFPATEGKIKMFKSGYGTVLFFVDTDVVTEYETKFALYKERFAPWSQQSAGMAQFSTWVALEAEGLGATLQHYNPLIDEQVRKEWNLPANWSLVSQMPFGTPSAPAGEKAFKPIDEVVKVFGGSL